MSRSSSTTATSGFHRRATRRPSEPSSASSTACPWLSSARRRSRRTWSWSSTSRTRRGRLTGLSFALGLWCWRGEGRGRRVEVVFPTAEGKQGHRGRKTRRRLPGTSRPAGRASCPVGVYTPAGPRHPGTAAAESAADERKESMYHVIEFVTGWWAKVERAPGQPLRQVRLHQGTRRRARVRPRSTEDGKAADLFFEDGTVARGVPLAALKSRPSRAPRPPGGR